MVWVSLEALVAVGGEGKREEEKMALVWEFFLD